MLCQLEFCWTQTSTLFPQGWTTAIVASKSKTPTAILKLQKESTTEACAWRWRKYLLPQTWTSIQWGRHWCDPKFKVHSEVGWLAEGEWQTRSSGTSSWMFADLWPWCWKCQTFQIGTRNLHLCESGEMRYSTSSSNLGDLHGQTGSTSNEWSQEADKLPYSDQRHEVALPEGWDASNYAAEMVWWPGEKRFQTIHVGAV